jgi:hypothetical protein
MKIATERKENRPKNKKGAEALFSFALIAALSLSRVTDI